MTVVDNNILSALAKIENLDLLPSLFETVGTPVAVVDELNRAEAAGYEFVNRIETAKSYNDGWLEIIAPTEAELALAAKIGNQCLRHLLRRKRRSLSVDSRSDH